MEATWAAELEAAQIARQAGNEGKARVCARRAAGMAAVAFLRRFHPEAHSGSAFQALLSLAEIPGIRADIRQAARMLTLRVTEQFTLPAEVDLIEQARFVCEHILDE